MAIKPKIEKILFATDLSENVVHAFTYAATLTESFRADKVNRLHF